MTTRIIIGDCLEVMPTLDACSVDAIVTDPPYGLSFMGKDWDHGIPGEHFWREALRVAKPGSHLVAFGGTRTHHRLMAAIEDAGWEIRDTLGWLFGSGFPKSLDVSKAIDKANGDARPVIGTRPAIPGVAFTQCSPASTGRHSIDVTSAASAASAAWSGWGTALKPAWEPIILARKPLTGTVAANVLKFGTGALNIDASRIPIDSAIDDPRLGGQGDWSSDKMAKNVYEGGYAGERVGSSPLGRWPANIIHDGSDEVVALFPESDGQSGAVTGNEPTANGFSGNVYGYGGIAQRATAQPRGDFGSAARFFYCAKADQQDRNAGLHHMAPVRRTDGRKTEHHVPNLRTTPAANHHPTVKPTDLMRYLCRLITPPGGLILDPFCGSGSTGKAAILEGFRFIGIELSGEYAAIARARIYGAAPLFAETCA